MPCSITSKMSLISMLKFLNEKDTLTLISVGSYSCLKTLNLNAGTGRGKVSAIIEGPIRDCLRNMNIHKSTGSDEMHPWVLKQLVDLAAKPLSIIFQKVIAVRQSLQ